MFDVFPTAFFFFAGALLFLATPNHVELAGQELEMMRVDRLSRIFGMIFCIAALLGNIYAWHVHDRVQQVAALLYAGSAIGAVFAGDFITLFIYWEGTAIASVFLIWARGTTAAYYTGMRYLIIQISSGVILLAGVALIYNETGSIEFELMTLGSLGTWLIFLSFGMKCAFPLLHNWLQDSYPAATITGTVILSAFTTKLAVYALARGFAGTEILIYIGAIMTLFPIFFAEIENDLRRVLAYSLNNQLGFMVVGIGIGTEMALNGTASHAFAHILYKALLFMSVGAVMLRTGTSKASELGGLYRTMPLTAMFCLVGAASISAFPWALPHSCVSSSVFSRTRSIPNCPIRSSISPTRCTMWSAKCSFSALRCWHSACSCSPKSTRRKCAPSTLISTSPTASSSRWSF